MSRLQVYFHQQRVGFLNGKPQARFTFQYDTDWLITANRFPVSVQLPLRQEVYADKECHAFFANLLPEGVQRELIAKRLHFSAQNDFKLLAAIGGDCAGALSVLLEDQPLTGQGSYEPLSIKQLLNITEQLAKTPLLNTESDVRLSLAGVQEKLPLYYDNGQFFLPHGSYASSHIIKPRLPHYSDSTENEWFCMQLAAKAGLNVAESFLVSNCHNLYCCKRFDRHVQNGRVMRLHQEDFCQAFGKMPSEKYESEGGIGIQGCIELIRKHSTQPIPDLEQLLKWVVFNFLIGNADAHSKNLALLQVDQGWRLAPFYDLLSTAVYPGLSNKFAMKIGGENRPDWLQQRHWERLAEIFGLRQASFMEQFKTFVKQVEACSNEYKTNGHAIIDRVCKHIQQQVKKIFK